MWRTLSGSEAVSSRSRRARASEYAPACTSSSICSFHGLMRNCHIELPCAFAVARSVGVVTRKRNDFAGRAVRRRTACWVAGALGCSSAGSGGKGRVWTGEREIEERISRTGDGTKLVHWEVEAAGFEVPFSWEVGTVPDGMTANTYGLMKAGEGSV